MVIFYCQCEGWAVGNGSCNFSINNQPRDWQHFEQKPPWHCQIPPWRPHPGGWKQGLLYYQPKQYIVMREIHQTYHRFVLFDSPQISNLMTPVEKLGKIFGKNKFGVMDVIPVDSSRRKLLVPLIGGSKDHIMIQLAVYTTYIQLRNNHWLMVQKSGVHPLIWKFLPLFTRFPLYVRWFSRWISPSTVFPTQTKCTLFKKAMNSLFKITTTFASKNLIPS